MEIILIASLVLQLILRVYTYVLWARLIIDWIRVFKPGYSPKGLALILIDFVFTLTDPPLKFFRKILPPISLGNVRLELGWMITMLACVILMGVLP